MEAEEAWHQTDRLHAGSGKGDPFAAAIRATRMPMIITDPRQADNPIVFANNAFLELAGYTREEVLGHNCRFLQGPDTDLGEVDRLRTAIRNVTDISVELLNYRKDGTPFWNALYVSPVVTASGELQFFFSSQLDVTGRRQAEHEIRRAKEHFERISEERDQAFQTAMQELQATNAKLKQALETQNALLHEVDHRVKNNLQMVSSLILLQSRSIPDQAIQASLREMLSRIDALGTVHRRLYQSDDVSRFDVGEFVRDLVSDLVGVAARERIDVKFDLTSVHVAAERAAPIALIVNEVVTNALKHAFPDGRKGVLEAKVTDGPRLCIIVSDDGVGAGLTESTIPSFGTSLVKILSRQLSADVSWTDNDPGTCVTISLPTS